MFDAIVAQRMRRANYSVEPWRAFQNWRLSRLAWMLAALLISTHIATAQGRYTLFGDFKVDESKVSGKLPVGFNVILYTEAGTAVARQTVMPGGRYSFTGIRSGEYELAVVVENREVARVRASVGGSTLMEFRQDIELEWRAPGNTKSSPRTTSVVEVYQRGANNELLFTKAQSAMANKKYSDAVNLLQLLVAADPKDFQGWTELGTAYFFQDKFGDAEKSYRRALEENPTATLTLLNLGRVLIAEKKFSNAIAPLTQVLELRSDSADANYWLGEAYLQTKQGSKAVPYLNEAARLGQAEAHLRLATLYHAVGWKSQAAHEYEEFLKKKPDYPDRKKLDQYIAEQKKP